VAHILCWTTYPLQFTCNAVDVVVAVVFVVIVNGEIGILVQNSENEVEANVGTTNYYIDYVNDIYILGQKGQAFIEIFLDDLYLFSKMVSLFALHSSSLIIFSFCFHFHDTEAAFSCEAIK
jgi:uncharacterized membrane protein